ncbi:MAG: hypothetical protein V1720_02490 [bacterium]
MKKYLFIISIIASLLPVDLFSTTTELQIYINNAANTTWKYRATKFDNSPIYDEWGNYTNEYNTAEQEAYTLLTDEAVEGKGFDFCEFWTNFIPGRVLMCGVYKIDIYKEFEPDQFEIVFSFIIDYRILPVLNNVLIYDLHFEYTNTGSEYIMTYKYFENGVGKTRRLYDGETVKSWEILEIPLN